MNWKKALVIGLTVVTSAAFLAGCGDEKKEAASGAKNNETIVIGLDDSFPPMGFRDKDNKIVGFDIDLANAVAKKLNTKVEFKPIDWGAKEAELNSGRISAIWNGLTVTPEREKKILFSKSYMKDDQIVVVLKDSPIKTLADLKGQVVGVQDGSSSLTALEKRKDVYDNVKSLKKYGDNVTALLDVKDKRINALVVDGVVGRYYIQSKPDIYRVLPQNLGMEEFAVGFSKNNKELADKVNKALSELKTDGTMKKISEKWFGTDITM